MPLGSLNGVDNFDNGNVTNPGVRVVAAAAVLTPLGLVTRITGTVPIATITPPSPYFHGPIWLFVSGAAVFTTVTTGNIALATTAVQGKALGLIYDPAVAKWYPTY